VSNPTNSLEWIDAVAATLVTRARPTTFSIATDRSEVEAAQRLRALAVVERGWVQADELPEGREEDADDDRAVHILATLDDEPIGTCRLIFPEPGRLLPMEATLGATRVPKEAVEIGRVVVVHPVARAQRSVMAGLIGTAWLELRANGYERICGTVSAPILRMYRRLGFVVEVLGPPVTTFGEERFPILFEASPEAAAVATARYSLRSGKSP
jgi:N-acyl-L-homoserine lactone synthetase